ncbi:hypothetical protein HD554DRAFT_2041968 [Boletus coccyginus]|nr:hypothetical protein HD554DRAFT_2041968 [Boletus coccyginus]
MTEHHAIDTRPANLHGKLTSRHNIQVIYREFHSQLIAKIQELQGGNTQHITIIENELQRQLKAQHGTFTYLSIAFAHSQSQVIVTEKLPKLGFANEHIRGREELEPRGLSDRDEAILAEHGSMLLPAKWGWKLTCDGIEAKHQQWLEPSPCWTTNTSDGQPILKIMNGPSGKESTKRKAPEDNKLMRGMLKEEGSQWKHKLYNWKIRKAMKIMYRILQANGKLIARTLDNSWNIEEMLKMQHCWDGLMGIHLEFECTFDQEIYNLELWGWNKKYSVTKVHKKYITRALSKDLPFIMKSIVPYDNLVDWCAPWSVLILGLTAVECALIRWQSGKEDRRQEEFLEWFWGAKSLQYAKSMRFLSKVKLDEIFHAVHTYLKINTHMAYDDDDV